MRKTIKGVIALLLTATVISVYPAVNTSAAPAAYTEIATADSIEDDFTFTTSINTETVGKFKDTDEVVNNSERALALDESVIVYFADGYKYYDGNMYDIYVKVTAKGYVATKWLSEVTSDYIRLEPNQNLERKDFELEVWLQDGSRTITDIDFICGNCYVAADERVKVYGTDGKLYTNIPAEKLSSKSDVADTTWWTTDSANNKRDKYIIGKGYTSDHHVKMRYATTKGTGIAEFVVGYLCYTFTYDYTEAGLGTVQSNVPIGEYFVVPNIKVPPTQHFKYWTCDRTLQLQGGEILSAGTHFGNDKLVKIFGDDSVLGITIKAHYEDHGITYPESGPTGVIAAGCSDPDCPFHNEDELVLTLTVPEEHGYSGSPIAITYGPGEAEAWAASTGLDVPTIVYYVDRDLENKTTARNSGALTEGGAPVDAGNYYALAILRDEHGEEISRAILPFTVTRYIDPEDAAKDLEESFINRQGGYIDYSARAHVTRNGFDADDNVVSGTYIDMTDEKLVTSLSVACFSTDGKKWKKATLEELNAALPKLLNNQTKLKIATDYDEKGKKPTSTATVVSFGTIKKRAATTKFIVNYYLCRDDFALTNGQWCLTVNNRGVDLDLYEIGISADGKKIGEKGYGVWPDGGVWPTCGGVWVSDVLSTGKTGKEIYFYRQIATADTPASKQAKITVTTVQAAPKVKVDYKKESIKLKEGMSIYFGATLPTWDKNTFCIKKLQDDRDSYEDYVGRAVLKLSKNQAKTAINIADYITETRNSLIVWQGATAKKAASTNAVIKLAARAAAPSAESCFTFSNGAAKLATGFEVYDSAKKKWGTAVPKKTSDVVVLVRAKSTVKSGKEDDTTFAGGVATRVQLNYGVYDATKNKKGFISATPAPTPVEE